MRSLRFILPALLALGTAQAADVSVPAPTSGNVSSNKDDAPPRTKSGKVEASTDVDRPPALGPAPAKVVVLIFSDFQCPVCKRSADATQQIAEEFPGDVRIEFWQHPLAIHANAENAAIASLAAQRQGRFWDYHDEVFRNQSSLDIASLEGYASGLGLDMDKFKSDFNAPELRDRVRAEAELAERLGAKSTPAFLVNGKLKTGWGSWYGFRGDVEHELAEANKLAEQGLAVDRIADQRAEAQIGDLEALKAYREKVLRAGQADPPAAKMSKKEKKKDKKKKDKDKTSS